MIGTIITSVLQIAVFFIKRSDMSRQSKEKFFEFIKHAGIELDSVKLFNAGVKQLEEFKNKPFEPEPGQ